MVSQGTRNLVNGCSIVGIAWIAFVFYAWISDREPWHAVFRFFRSYGGTFSVLVLAGMIPIGLIGYCVWWLFLRSRDSVT